MVFFVHPKILGTKKYLRCDSTTGSYSWVSSIDEDSWVYGDRSVVNSIDILLELLGKEFPVVVPDQYMRSLKILGIDSMSGVPWHNVLPAYRFHDLIRDMVGVLSSTLCAFKEYEYGETFIRQRGLLMGLTRALVDRKKLQEYTVGEKNPTILCILNSFIPLTDGSTKNITYNQSSTATGRLTVMSGPSILTLPKKYRDVLKSRHIGGKVVQVDFVSLEPRLASLVAGHTPKKDIYDDISKSLFQNKLNRDQTKIAVLCALYGASARKLSSMITNDLNPTRVISDVKNYFSIHDLAFRLKNQFFQTGKIKNYFGKDLEPAKEDDNILVNHYIQSAAVDISLLGFEQLAGQVQKEELNIQPMFIIHDALVLDVHPDDITRLTEIINKGIDIDGLGNFPIEIDTISSN